MNMKSAYLFNSKEFKRRTTKVEIEKLVEANKEYQKNPLQEITSTKTTLPCKENSKKTHIQLLCNYPLGFTTTMQLSPKKYDVLINKLPC